MDGPRPIRACRILQHNYNESLMYASSRYQAPLNRGGSRRGGRSKKHSKRGRRGLDNESSESSSSTSSSSSDNEGRIRTADNDYNEETRFERRKLRSLQKSRKNLMPMNFTGFF